MWVIEDGIGDVLSGGLLDQDWFFATGSDTDDQEPGEARN
jgi:hypothetical protein